MTYMDFGETFAGTNGRIIKTRSKLESYAFACLFIVYVVNEMFKISKYQIILSSYIILHILHVLHI